MATVKMFGDWAKCALLLQKMGNPAIWQTAKNGALAEECHRLRRLMIEAFNKSGPGSAKWKPLSKLTVEIDKALGKGRRKPLMDTGNLRNSHSVIHEGDVWFVGVHRTTKGRNGQDMVNLAIIHEYGTKTFTVPCDKDSDKGKRVRKFFMWLSIKSNGRIKPLKDSTRVLVVRIPARPWVGPIWEAEQERSARNVFVGTVRRLGLPFVPPSRV